MTYNEFLVELRKVAKTRKFKLIAYRGDTSGSLIRTSKGGLCPIQAIGGNTCEEGCGLELSVGTWSRIMDAADGSRNATRRDLIKACGLKESR